MFCSCFADDSNSAPVETLVTYPLHQAPVENEARPQPQQQQPAKEQKGGLIEQSNEQTIVPETQTQADDEFVVELQKTAEQSKIGLEVDKHWGRILILQVKKGLIDDYNQRAEKEGLQEVKPGYQIVSVNGINESPKKMLDAVAAHSNLRLVVRVGETKK
mmetsp:Transcript_95/g.334  ORF Transcript_95/g.334 Transcript_95/m.334 type:complete len:160 (+) Transcript_95:63-542(+)